MKYTVLPRSKSISQIFSVTPSSVSSLWYFLNTISDRRRSQGRRYPLGVILTLSVLALCCGETSYQAMSEWVENYQEEINDKVPFLAGYFPDPATIYRVFADLDILAFEQALGEFLQAICYLEENEGIAIDGKSVGKSGLHLVAAFAHQMRSVLFEMGTDTKGKELVVGPKVLEKISIKNHVITGDALFAQKKICDQITKNGGGFVFVVKGNQELLENDLRFFFNSPPFGTEIETDTTAEKSHGQMEERSVESAVSPTGFVSFPGVTHIFRLSREVEKDCNVATEQVVGIARLLREDGPAKQINSFVRGHWQIENRLHRQRDVVFGEDKCPIRKRNAPQVMAALKNLVISLFHRAAVRSFPGAFRRFRADPTELFTLLGLTEVAKSYVYA